MEEAQSTRSLNSGEEELPDTVAVGVPAGSAAHAQASLEETPASGGPGLLDFGIIVLLSLIWGSIFILYKGSLKVFTWQQVGLLRVLISGLSLSPLAFYWIRRVPKNKLLFIAAVGLLGSGIPPFLFALAQTHLDSGLTGILNATTPVFALLLGMAFFRLKVATAKIAGIFLGLAGAITIVGSGATGFSGDGVFGLFVLLATTCYGASINLIKSRLQDVSPIGITVLSLLFIASLATMAIPFSGIVQVWSDAPQATSFSGLARWEGNSPSVWQATGMVALMALLGTTISSIFYFRLIQRTNVVFASSITYLIPVVAIGWGVWDGERLMPMHFVGMGLILMAVWLISRKTAPQKTASS